MKCLSGHGLMQDAQMQPDQEDFSSVCREGRSWDVKLGSKVLVFIVIKDGKRSFQNPKYKKEYRTGPVETGEKLPRFKHAWEICMLRSMQGNSSGNRTIWEAELTREATLKIEH